MSLLEEPITTASGWTCLGKREGKGKGCQAPSGKQFRSKRAALEHLLSTGAPLDQVQIWKKLPHVLIFNIPNDFAIKVSPSQVREVQDLMIMRGFTRSGLPQRWLAKAEPKGYRFITDTAVQLIGKIKADAYLQQAGGSEQDRKLVAEFNNNQGERGERATVFYVQLQMSEIL